MAFLTPAIKKCVRCNNHSSIVFLDTSFKAPHITDCSMGDTVYCTVECISIPAYQQILGNNLHSISKPFGLMPPHYDGSDIYMNGSMKEPNKFHNYKTEKITRKASDTAEYIELFGSSTRDRHVRRI